MYNINLKKKTFASVRLCWLIKDTYIFSFIWHRYCLFTPLVTSFFFFFSTPHHKIATIHNIHIGTGSGLKCFRGALAPTFMKSISLSHSDLAACFGTQKKALTIQSMHYIYFHLTFKTKFLSTPQALLCSNRTR